MGVSGAATVGAADRVCFFAHYNPDGIVADYVWSYLSALDAIGFSTVFISASAISSADRVRLEEMVAAVLVRDNRGLDFGGWIDACQAYFPLTAEFLLLANDSVYAPAGDLASFFERLVSIPADFYGAVESGERGRHLQSWFLLFRPSAYRSDAFRSLMLRPMPTLPFKAALIDYYEIGLSQRLVDAGLTYHAAFSPLTHGGLAVARPYNPMHLLWDQVLAASVPFVKAELVRSDPLRAANDRMRRELLARYAPTLDRMIADDLKDRGCTKTPTRLSLTQTPAINWPEVRFLVRSDFHRPLAWPIYLLAYRAIVAVAAPFRRLLQRSRS